MDPNSLMCQTLSKQPWGDKVIRTMLAALDAVEPRASVLRALSRDGKHFRAGEQSYDLSEINKITLIGIGKAGVPMSRAVMDVMGDYVSSGLVIVKDGYAREADSLAPVDVIEAGHPLPDERAVRAAQRVREMLSETGEADLLLSLISGGGSALFTSPVSGVGLDDLISLTEIFLECGADIEETNVVRKHIDQVKGGGLAATTYPAAALSLILSDVVGDKLDIIASGPTVPDPSTFAQALQVLAKYQLVQRIPESIINHLERGQKGEVPETPKPGSRIFDRVQNLIVGNNTMASEAALKQAVAEGFTTQFLTAQMQGEASIVGEEMGNLLRKRTGPDQVVSRPFCLLAGGETTVTLRGDGIGGRNQELALAAVETLKGLPDVALLTLATDGGDGPTDAAGAVVTGDTFNRSKELGMDPSAYLENNDSYSFFDHLGDNLKTGPTQTNVNDLVFLFAF